MDRGSRAGIVGAKRGVFVVTVILMTVVMWTPRVPAQAQRDASRDAASAGLLQSSNLHYLGAFRFPVLPDEAVIPGGAVVHNPDRKTLLVVTHSQRIIEITMPEPVNSEVLEELPVAKLVAGPVDVLQGKRGTVDGDRANGAPIYGLFIDDAGRLIVAVTRFYDGEGTQQRSHFISGTDLNNLPEVKGPFQVGKTFSSAAGFAGGWMAAIPPPWRASFGGKPAVAGQCCISILHRTSAGPSISEFDPADLGVVNPAPARPRIAYPPNRTTIGGYDSQWGQKGVFYHMTTDIVGVALIEQYRTVAFVGRNGTGRNCYGTGASCNDPHDRDQGPHAPPYENALWLYSLDSVVKARNYSDPVPYAYVPLSFARSGGDHRLAGAWYDPEAKRFYVMSRAGDSNGTDRWYGLVHVIQIQ